MGVVIWDGDVPSSKDVEGVAPRANGGRGLRDRDFRRSVSVVRMLGREEMTRVLGVCVKARDVPVRRAASMMVLKRTIAERRGIAAIANWISAAVAQE